MDGGSIARSALLSAAGLALTLAPAQAGAYGTIYSGGQNGEHERMTRAALACPVGMRSTGDCFEPVSMLQLAGERGGGFGGVGITDVPPSPPADHCDDGDFLDTSLFPRVARYPRSRTDADNALMACRTVMVDRFQQGLAAAPRLLDARNRIVAAEVDLSSTCTFLGGTSGRAKCDVVDGFGRSLHTVQDFYGHTNWSDRPVPIADVTLDDPPGLGRTVIASFTDLRMIGPPSIPPLLISGCFSLYEVGSPVDGCLSGIRRVPRVKHEVVNKDYGTIDPVTGAATAPTTVRGRVGTNFASSVRLAIADTRRQWSDMRAEIIRLNGAKRGNLIVCALTRDNPVRDCQARKLGIVIDSSGSNTETDPDNLRIDAGVEFNAGLVSAAEAGPDGGADRSAVIDFDDSARVVSPLGDPGAASFDGIDSSGGTSIAGGVNLAIDELTRDPADPTADRSGIVVLTDGQDSDRSALIDAVNRAGSLGIRVSFGFLSPPANPVPSQTARTAAGRGRQLQSTGAPPADLVAAIVASGGVFSTINSAAAQRAFVGLVQSRGATNLDDPNGADDGGPLASGVSTTAIAAPGGDRDTFSYQATRGRVLTLRVRALTGQRLGVRVRDVWAGSALISTRKRTDGVAAMEARPRRSRLLEVDVTGTGAGGPYAVELVEAGVDRIGTGRADRLRCGALPTYVSGAAGADRITCGAGDDMISGGPGADAIAAGPGDDVILVAARDRHRGTERVAGGAGTDVVEFATGRGRSVPIPRGRPVVVDVGAAHFALTGVEVVRFGARG